MSKLTRTIEDPAFRGRLAAACALGTVVMACRTADGGEDRADSRSGAAAAKLDACFDDLEKAAGMAISHANIFCSPERATLTATFAIEGVDSDLAVYHDTSTGRTEYQILHRDEITVVIASQSDLLALFAEPDLLVDHHHNQAGAAAVRAVIARLGLEVAPTRGEALEYATCFIALRDRSEKRKEEE